MYTSVSELKRLCHQRISNAERYMAQQGIDPNSTYAIILARARSEWSRGNYMQALKDLGALPYYK